MIRFIGAGSITFVMGALLLAADAQEQPKQPPTEQAATSYVPELAELMNITQLRFSRLSYAPEADNWALAAYEAAHLRKNFSTAAKLYPVFRNVQQEKLIRKVTEPTLNTIDKAISSKDLPAFVSAIEILRNACNGCHVQAGADFIRIDSPRKPLTGPQAKEPR